MQTLADDYQMRSEALQSEMAELKKSDGGKLTPAHQEYLQAKLIALLDAYHNAVQKYEPMTVNANGRLSH